MAYIMNWLKITSLAILLFTLSFSCEKLFDLDNSLDDPIQSFSSLEDIEGAILGVYDRGRFVHSSDDYSMFKLCHSDEIMLGSNLSDQPVFEQFARLKSFDAGNDAVEQIWNGYYTGLTIANMILEAKDAVEINESSMSEVNRKNKVLGEAHYFRAYFHLSLIERWDHIALANHVFNNPDENLVLADSTDVYNSIEADLLEAIVLLPEAIPGNPGKVSKGVARHVLSLVYLNMKKYPEAAAMAELVINDPAYELVSSANIADIFSCKHQENSEIIFSWTFSRADQGNPQRCSVQLVPLYTRVFGVGYSWEGGGRPWSRLLPSPYYWTVFEPNDLRLEAWHKRFWTYDVDIPFFDPLPSGVSIGDTVTTDNFQGTEENIDINQLIIPTTRKYWEDNTFGRKLDLAEGYRNIILYRISQAYLIAAEAYMRAGQVSEGQSFLDSIRARAGVASIPLTEANLIDEYLRELGLEGHRYAFLKRLGILYDRVINYCPVVNEVYQPYHIRWPIPQQFVDITKVPQNEGY
jgi:starch-binding outer membrane protein, SusD/RagB family